MQHINSSGIDVKMLDNALNETIRGAHPPGQISPFNKKAPTGGSGSKCEHPMMPTMEKESGPIDGVCKVNTIRGSPHRESHPSTIALYLAASRPSGRSPHDRFVPDAMQGQQESNRSGAEPVAILYAWGPPSASCDRIAGAPSWVTVRSCLFDGSSRR